MSSGTVRAGKTYLESVGVSSRWLLGTDPVSRANAPQYARSAWLDTQWRPHQLGMAPMDWGPRGGLDMDGSIRLPRRARITSLDPRPTAIDYWSGTLPQEDIYQFGRILAKPEHGPYIGFNAAPGTRFLMQDYLSRLVKSYVG